MKSDEPAPHRIGKKNEEGPIYGKRAVRGAERRIRLPALCARLAAGGSDAEPLSRRPCHGGDGCRHARRLLAAVYLITGERYCPAICYPPLRCDGYCAALRERYHEEVCGGFNYRRASQETLDPCLQQLLLAFSQDEYRHANAMLCLLSGVM